MNQKSLDLWTEQPLPSDRQGLFAVCRTLISLDFLIEIAKQVRVEKLCDGHVQAVNEFFEGDNADVGTGAFEKVVSGGLGDSGQHGQPIDGKFPLVQ